MKPHDYAIRLKTVEGVQVYIPLAYGDEALSQKVADKWVWDKIMDYRVRDADGEIDWSTVEVVRREVGEWESYESGNLENI